VCQAFALDFPHGESSPPSLVARGEFDTAHFMVSVARKYGVPIVEREEMCGMLEDVQVGQSIPRRLYEAAAAILVEIGAIQRSRRR
jgi:flagellar biosynthesis protein